MTDSQISVKEFAENNGLHRQTVFRVLKRLRIEPSKSRGGEQNRGQTISYISQQDGRKVLEALASTRRQEDTDIPDASLYDIGVFYLLSLEPEHDPSRFKVGFANNLNERLRQHRCAAPFANVVQTWPCRRLWEKTAIECVTDGCERLHTEVFRAQSLAIIEEKCAQFFAMMPKLTEAQTT